VSLKKSVKEVGQIFPVIKDQYGNILDGRHRKQVDPNWKETIVEVKDEVEALRIRVHANLVRRKVSNEEKREWVREAREIFRRKYGREGTVREIAELLGTHQMFVNRYDVLSNVVTSVTTCKSINVEPEIAAKVKQVPISECFKEVEPNSVDLILTDPPYAYEKLEVWTYLSKFAAHALKPGKLLITYSGKAYLPEIYRRLNQHLDYIWTIALIHTSNQRTYFPKLKIFERWKPLLIFAKPTYTPTRFFEDIIIGSGREKDLHPHAQALKEAIEIIERFTDKNDLVVDPFCGSGTVLKAAQLTERRFLGFDIDETAIQKTLLRLQGELE
jgi:site-specific DNA-methyltransferase (adenine-specific)